MIMFGKKLVTKHNNSTKIRPIDNDSSINNGDISFESDDDENPIHNTSLVPSEWYKYENHCGYDREGRRILKPSEITELEKFISQANDDKRIIRDQFGNVLATLTDSDLELIQRICKRQYPNKDYDPESVYVEFDKSDSAFPVREPIYRKDSYLPSKHEYKKIKKIIESLQKRDLSIHDDDDDIWKDNLYTASERAMRRKIHDLIAPKLPLPKSDESYNPPEHLIQSDANIDDDVRYITKKYDALRHVPGYKYYLIERFERCMDLYLCPRANRVKMNIDIKALLSSIPKMDYDQLGNEISIDYYTDLPSKIVRVDSTGRFVAIISGDSTLQIFNLLNGRRCLKIELSDSINDLAWHPNLPVIALAKGSEILIMAINLHTKYTSYYGDSDFIEDIEDDYSKAMTYASVDKTRRCTFNDVIIKWKKGIGVKHEDVVGFTIYHHVSIKKLTFHMKGYYIAVILQNGTRMSDQVMIHSMKKQNSIFLKANVSNVRVNRILFHPINSQLVVGTTLGLMYVNLRNDGKIINKLSGLTEVKSVDLNNRLMIASGDNGTVSIYDLENENSIIKSFNFPNIFEVKVHRILPLLYIIQQGGKISVFYAKIEEEDVNILPCKQMILKVNHLMDYTLHPNKAWFIVASNDTRCHLYV